MANANTATITTVDQAAGQGLVNDQMTEMYRGIPLGKLKPTTRKQLLTWWEKATEGLVKFEPNVTSVELLGDEFLSSNHKLFWKGYEDAATLVTLGDLAETREAENESQHLQFEIQMARVEKLLTDKDDGILKYKPLMQPIVCMRLPKSEQFIVVSGRHRLSMLLTLAQVLSGWEELLVPVLMLQAESAIEVASYVRTANGSRSMTATEKSMIEGAANGINLSVYRDADELFKDSEKADNITQLKKYNRSIWGSFLSGTPVDASCSLNGIGDIGNAALNTVCSRLKALHKGADKILLEKEGDATIYQQLITKMMSYTIEAWDREIRGEFQEPIKERGGAVKLDENNNPMMSFNPSRKASKIGKMIGNLFADKVAEHLAASYKNLEQQRNSEKEAKKAKKAANSVGTDIKNLDNILALMKQQGRLTPEVEQSMLEQRQVLVNLMQEQQAAEQQQVQAAIPVPQPNAEVANMPVGIDPNSLF